MINPRFCNDKTEPAMARRIKDILRNTFKEELAFHITDRKINTKVLM